jgi:hypothetical protein
MTIKQYVNLPSGTTNVYGPRRDLRVTPDSVPNVGPGDRVEWWIEPDAGNTDETYLSLAQRAKLRRAQTTLSRRAFQNRLTLPHVGGDKFVVKAAKRNERANFHATDTFETWRKLYYSVFYMGNDALNLFNRLEPDFKNAFALGNIELENIQKTAALTVMARVDLSTSAAIGRPNFYFLGGTRQRQGIIDLRPTGRGRLANKPFHIAIIVVPDIYRVSDVRVSQNITSANVSGWDSVNSRLFQHPSDPRAFVYTARVTWWRFLRRHRVDVKPLMSLIGNPDDGRFQWDLNSVPGLTPWLRTAGHSATLDMSLVQESPGIMGYSIYNLCVVRTVDGLTSVLETFTHEVGHGIEQTVQRESKFNNAGAPNGQEDNPYWHTDNFGGRGDHCSYNAVLDTASAPAGLTSVYIYGGAGQLCTMYYADESHVDPKGKFCIHCLPRVKRVNLNRASMITRWNYFG